MEFAHRLTLRKVDIPDFEGGMLMRVDEHVWALRRFLLI
jgi:hypothetical protein